MKKNMISPEDFQAFSIKQKKGVYDAFIKSLIWHLNDGWSFNYSLAKSLNDGNILKISMLSVFDTKKTLARLNDVYQYYKEVCEKNPGKIVHIDFNKWLK